MELSPSRLAHRAFQQQHQILNQHPNQNHITWYKYVQLAEMNMEMGTGVNKMRLKNLVQQVWINQF